MLGIQEFVCNLTLKNYPSVDIFVFDPKKKLTINIQVKTTKKTSYQVGLNRNQREDINEIITCPFVFVHIGKDNKVSYYILSKEQLIDLIIKTDDNYYNRKREVPLKDYPIAINLKDLAIYNDEWSNLWK